MARSNITTSESAVEKQIKLDKGVQMWISHGEWLLHGASYATLLESKQDLPN